MISFLGALLFGLTVAALALAVKPPAARLRHEPVKERDARKANRRRARFRVREVAAAPVGKWQRFRLALIRRRG